MNRREFITSVAAALAAPADPAQAVTHASRQDARAASGSKRPKNVVLMICDDLGYGDLGCYGSSLPTPNLNRLAAEGMRFLRFNAAHPICSASRGALLTGRYAQRSHTKGCYFPLDKTGMSLEETTLANLFKEQGYRTKAIGKWHLGDAPAYLPTQRGFESFYGVPYSDDMEPLPLLRDNTILERETDRNLLTPRYTEKALRFLAEEPEKPFFLYLAFSYPHDPAAASPRFQGKSGFGDYGDAVQEIDWSVGEIVHTLKEKNLLEDTLIFFTSDHGPWFQGSVANMRGRKSSTFEGGFRVPLIAHWPGVIPRGAVSEVWGSNLDLLPTIVSLCGLRFPALPLDGIDLSAALREEQKDFPRKAILYFTPFSSGGADLHCARKGKWKLRVAQLDGEIYINDYTDGCQSFWLPRPELYDLEADPGESYDVAALHPDIVRDISDEIAAQVQTMPAGVQTAFAQLRKNVAQALTRPGAAPRPANMTIPQWAWQPKDRR
jgi:arylsulfatase